MAYWVLVGPSASTVILTRSRAATVHTDIPNQGMVFGAQWECGVWGDHGVNSGSAGCGCRETMGSTGCAGIGRKEDVQPGGNFNGHTILWVGRGEKREEERKLSNST
jgi:hypothetical protein